MSCFNRKHTTEENLKRLKMRLMEFKIKAKLISRRATTSHIETLKIKSDLQHQLGNTSNKNEILK